MKISFNLAICHCHYSYDDNRFSDFYSLECFSFIVIMPVYMLLDFFSRCFYASRFFSKRTHFCLRPDLVRHYDRNASHLLRQKDVVVVAIDYQSGGFSVMKSGLSE